MYSTDFSVGIFNTNMKLYFLNTLHIADHLESNRTDHISSLLLLQRTVSVALFYELSVQNASSEMHEVNPDPTSFSVSGSKLKLSRMLAFFLCACR